MDYLDRRQNFKLFKTDVDVDKDLEQILDKIIARSPVQTSQRDVVRFFKCNIKDKKTKEILSAYIFRNDATKLVELAPITAPLVYFCFNGKGKHHDIQHANIIGGAMMIATLRFGYDFSFIACTSERNIESKQKIIQNELRERFNIHKKDKMGVPFMALCIGRGDNSFIREAEYKLHNGVRVKYSTIKGYKEKPQMLYE